MECGSLLPLWPGRLAGRAQEVVTVRARASSLRESGSLLPHSKAAPRSALLGLSTALFA